MKVHIYAVVQALEDQLTEEQSHKLAVAIARLVGGPIMMGSIVRGAYEQTIPGPLCAALRSVFPREHPLVEVSEELPPGFGPTE